MKKINVRALAVLVVTAFGAVGAWQFWPRTYVGTCEVEIAGGTKGLDASFRARCICKEVVRAESLEALADGIVKSDKTFKSSRADVLDLLGSVKTSVDEGPPVVIAVIVKSGSWEMSRSVVEQFADVIVRRIEDDARSLDETMEKWFDTQIHHKRKRNEGVTLLVRQKEQARKNAESKAITARIRKVTVCEGV